MTKQIFNPPRLGVLCTDDERGSVCTRILILEEAASTATIRAITRTRLQGMNKYLEIGKTAKVPKHAVKFVKQ
jgi:hypothetical protein